MGSSSFLAQIKPLSLLSTIYFLNFLSRIILSPILPMIQKDLKVGHHEAGSLFLMISLGYSIMLPISGFFSSRLNHRRTIIISSFCVGGCLIFISMNHHLWIIRLGLFSMGMAAGLYLPSGIATLTELVDQKDWGKAIGIHEFASNLAFVLAPFLVEALLKWGSWRSVPMLLGVVSILTGIVFIFWGRGGTFAGEPPKPKIIKIILPERSLWIMVILFGLALGASFGVYSMIPLYLTSVKGIDHSWANTLLGLSWISALPFSIIIGWITDYMGVRTTLKTVLLATSLVTILMGLAPGRWIVIIIFLQPIFASCFFTPGYAVLSKIGPPNIKNVIVSITIPISFLIGGGIIPTGIGFLGEVGLFYLGFIFLGVVISGSVLLVPYIKFYSEKQLNEGDCRLEKTLNVKNNLPIL